MMPNTDASKNAWKITAALLTVLSAILMFILQAEYGQRIEMAKNISTMQADIREMNAIITLAMAQRYTSADAARDRAEFERRFDRLERIHGMN